MPKSDFGSKCNQQRSPGEKLSLELKFSDIDNKVTDNHIYHEYLIHTNPVRSDRLKTKHYNRRNKFPANNNLE